MKPKVVAIVLAETSTGAWQPIEEIAAAVRDAGAMLILDTVTALGGIPVEIDKWQIDAVYSGTQKCLSCPPGLAPVSFSDRAVEKILKPQAKGAQLVSRRVADRQLLGRRPRLPSHGPDQHDLRAARSAAARAGRRPRSVLAPGIARITRRSRRAWRRSASTTRRSRATSCRSSTPCGFPRASTTLAVRKALLGAIRHRDRRRPGRVQRQGLADRPDGLQQPAENVLKLLDALEQLLAEQKCKIERGAGVAAARVVLGQR